MRARNKLLFSQNESYNRKGTELCKNISLFHRCDFLPENADNPCVKCGICESRCTQKLSIIDGVSDFYERAEKCGYSLSARANRVKSIFEHKKYSRVGLFPNGGFANYIVDTYNAVFVNPDFEWVLFNNNKSLRGKSENGLIIHAPDDIAGINPDIIIVCSYKYEDEIYKQLLEYEKNGVEIIKLHSANDVPWVW
jgi:ferredoxin